MERSPLSLPVDREQSQYLGGPASIGQTGAATGPHLHLEYRVNGRYLDIHEYLNF